MAAWRTENGTWSDPAHKGGYFTGSTELKSLSDTFWSTRFTSGLLTSGDRPVKGPNLNYWKSIHASPANSRARATPCILSG